MKRLLLTQSVPIIEGKSPTGGTAWIKFDPMPNNERGVFWKVPNLITGDYDYIPIDYRIAKMSKLHNIYLEHGNNILFVYEHIGALRSLGFDGFSIEASNWPPYVTTWYIAERMLRYSKETDEDIPFFSFKQKYYPPLCLHEDGLDKSVEIIPSPNGETILNISIDYRRFKIRDKKRMSVNKDLLENIFPIGPQGISRPLLFLSKLLHCEYHRIVVWPHKEKNKELLTWKFIAHTMVDRLGELSLFSHYMLPSCELVSHCAGHKMVLQLIKDISEKEIFVPAKMQHHPN